MKAQQILYFKRQVKIGDNKKDEIKSYVEAQEHEACVVYDGKKIKIASENEKEAVIAGFISVSEKGNRAENQPIDNIDSIIDEKVAIHKKKKISERIVGYIGINDKTYAIVKKKPVGIKYLTILILAIILGLALVKPMKISLNTGQVVIEQVENEENATGLEDIER